MKENKEIGHCYSGEKAIVRPLNECPGYKREGQEFSVKKRTRSQAKAHLKKLGHTYRTASPHIGRSYQFINRVLNGSEKSQPLIDAIFTLEPRNATDKPQPISGWTTQKLFRACADCEQEAGILDRSDARKSHGMCRRHFHASLVSAGLTTEAAWIEADKLSPTAFCPDLKIAAK